MRRFGPRSRFWWHCSINAKLPRLRLLASVDQSVAFRATCCLCPQLVPNNPTRFVFLLSWLFCAKGENWNDLLWHGPTNPCNQVISLPVLVNNASHWRDQNVTWGDCSGIEWLSTREMILTIFFIPLSPCLMVKQTRRLADSFFSLGSWIEWEKTIFFFSFRGSASKQPAGRRGAHRWNASNHFKANDLRRKHKFTRQGSQLLSVMPRIHPDLIGCPVVSIQ